MDFDAAYARYWLLIYRRCLRLLGNASDAQDAAQEVWIKAWRAWARRPVGKEIQWLYVIARHVACDMFSSPRTRGMVPLLDGDHAPMRARRDIERVAIQREEIGRADAAAGDVGAGLIAVLGAIAHEYEYHEIAEGLGIPLGTVRSRVHRARAELRKRVA